MPFSLRHVLATTTALATVATVAVGAVAANATPSPAASVAIDGTERHFGLDIEKSVNTSGRVDTVGQPVVGKSGIQRSDVNTRALPVSYSNERLAATPGDQGRVGSCVSWAVGWSGYGSLMNKQKIPGFPMAPMYIHSQVSGDRDKGTTVPTALNLLMRQGIATSAVYWQGPFDYATLPTDEQRRNAAQYKLSGYYRISPWASDARQQIKRAVVQGMPVIISVRVKENFMRMSPETARDWSYFPDGKIKGGHAMEVIGYDEKGVRVQNSWGDDWADGGRFNYSWDALFNSDTLTDINAMGDITYRPNGVWSTTTSSTTSSTTVSTSTPPVSTTTTRPTTSTTSTTPSITTYPAGSPFPRPTPGTQPFRFVWNGGTYFWDGHRAWLVG